MLANRVRMGVSKDNGFILYDYGIENVPFVGWDIDGDKYPDYTKYEVSKYPDHLYLYSTNWSAPPPPGVGFTTVNKINIEKYSTLNILWDWNSTFNREGVFGITDMQKPIYTSDFDSAFFFNVMDEGTGLHTNTVDISDLEGSYYVSVTTGHRMEVKIYKVWLE